MRIDRIVERGIEFFSDTGVFGPYDGSTRIINDVSIDWLLGELKEPARVHRKRAILNRIIAALCPYEVRVTNGDMSWVTGHMELEGKFLGVATFYHWGFQSERYDHRFCFSNASDAVHFKLGPRYRQPRRYFWVVPPRIVIQFIRLPTIKVQVFNGIDEARILAGISTEHLLPV